MALILGVDVLPSDYNQVVDNTVRWALRSESRALVFANVHVIMEAFDDPAYLRCLNAADMVNPDGVPLVWTLKGLGHAQAGRVYGPDCTLAMLRAAAERDIPVGFYGSSPEVLTTVLSVLAVRFPMLRVTYAVSPPFRPLTSEEDAAVVDEITRSGARILFVGLGCPKQERWIIDHLGRIPAVMYGVGAAFDFIAGTKKQAPRWMMKSGLEWVFRFCTEPRRLARRYLKHNPRFALLIARQLLVSRGGNLKQA